MTSGFGARSSEEHLLHQLSISSITRGSQSIVTMASSFVRSAFRGHVLRAGKQAAFAPTIFVRGKATLPDLPCELRNYSIQTLCSSHTIADHDFKQTTMVLSNQPSRARSWNFTIQSITKPMSTLTMMLQRKWPPQKPKMTQLQRSLSNP